MYTLYLFHNKIQKAAEHYKSHLLAYRSGENWEMLNKGNTFTILEINDNRNKRLKDIEYDIHMDELLRGFI